MMQHPDKVKFPSRSYLLLAVIILLWGTLLRLEASMRLPLFLDEAIHISRARRVLAGDWFIGFENSKWLYSVFLASFRPTGPETPWLARSLSALLGALSMAGCVALGRDLDSRRAGLLAGLIYAMMPLAVFHERQALVDPLLTMFTTISTVLTVKTAHRPRLGVAMLLGLTLAGAYLTKVAALPYLILPVAAVVLLARRFNLGWRALGLAAMSVGLSIGLAALASHQAVLAGHAPSPIYRVSLDNLAVSGSGQTFQWLRLVGDLREYLTILWRYVGVGGLMLAILSGAWAAMGERRRAILFLAFPALLFAAVPLLAERPAEFLAPRYLMTTAVPLAVLIGLSLRITLSRLNTYGKVASWLGGAALLAATLVQPLWFDVALMLDPARAPLTDVDVAQYIVGDPSGRGRVEAAEALLAIWREGGGTPVDVLATGSGVQIAAYLGPRVGAYDGLRPESTGQRAALAGWLAAGEQVFMIEGGANAPIPDSPHGANLRQVGAYAGEAGTIRLFQVIGGEGALAEEIYARIAPEPERMEDDYAALVAQLVEGSVPRPVLAFPANHADFLAEMTASSVIPITPTVWPLDADAAEEALAASQWDEDVAPIEAVLVDEAHTDPDRVLALTLQDSLYRVDDAWFGYLHRLSYVTGPADPEMAPLGAHYEGVIELVSAGVLDPEVAPGDPIRIALAWRSPVEVQDSFQIFIHVMDEQGNLWAQRDRAPGDGLLPMPSWQPGQTVVDRFAIRLPTDVPPGSYELRVGLYYPESGIRLAVTDGPVVGPDYVVVGLLVVSPSAQTGGQQTP